MHKMTGVTYEQVLKFYLGKSSECAPLLKEYILEFGQKDGGYLDVADDFEFYYTCFGQDCVFKEVELYDSIKAQSIKDYSMLDINKGNFSDNQKKCILNMETHKKHPKNTQVKKRYILKKDNIEYCNELKRFLCNRVNLIKNNDVHKAFNDILNATESIILYELINQVYNNSTDIKNNQKWHLIISYMLYQLLYRVQESGVKWGNPMKTSELDHSFDYYKNAGGNGSKSPELMLWMIEVSGLNIDYNNILNKAKEYKQINLDEEGFNELQFRIDMCKFIKGKYPWDDIEKIINKECRLSEGNSEEE